MLFKCPNFRVLRQTFGFPKLNLNALEFFSFLWSQLFFIQSSVLLHLIADIDVYFLLYGDLSNLFQ